MLSTMCISGWREVPRESFYLFTGEQIGDPDILDDEKVANYFGRLLAEKGWSAVRGDAIGPDDQIATWNLAPGS